MLLKSICLVVLIGVLFVSIMFRDKIKQKSLLLIVISILYFGILMWFTIIRKNSVSSFNSFVPFSSCWHITQVRWYGNGEYIFRATIGNVLLFVPIGLLIAGFFQFQHPFLLSGLFGFVISLIIELTQSYMALGVFETDDIIFNTWGALIGCSIATFILDDRKKQKRSRIFSLTPLIILIGLMVLICIVPISKEILIVLK